MFSLESSDALQQGLEKVVKYPSNISYKVLSNPVCFGPTLGPVVKQGALQRFPPSFFESKIVVVKIYV